MGHLDHNFIVDQGQNLAGAQQSKTTTFWSRPLKLPDNSPTGY